MKTNKTTRILAVITALSLMLNLYLIGIGAAGSLAGDMDGNGVVNVDDAIYLLQHVLMPDLFPLGGGNSGTEPEDPTEETQKPGGRVRLSIGIPANAMILDHDNNALTNWVEETCNVDLQFIEYAGGTDVATQISTTIAARQELPDILFGMSLSDSFITRLGKDGYLVDLSEYYEDKDGASRNFWDRMENELSEYEQELVLDKITDPTSGGIYSVPVVEKSLVDSMQFQPWINQTWLDKLGLEKPTNLAELYEVLIAFRDQDPNGNRIKDEIPLFGSQRAMNSNPVDWLMNMFCYYDSSKPLNVGPDGQLYPAYTSESYREGLKFINQMYEEQLLTSLAWTASNSEMKMITTPASGTAICGIFLGNLTTCTAANNEILYEYEPLTFWGSAVRKDINCNQTTFISEDCDDPDRAFQVLMALWSWEGSMRVRYGEYGVNWVDADPGAKSAMGLDATYKLISDPLTVQSAAKWAKVASCLNVYSEGETAQVDPDLSPWYAAREQLKAQSYANFERAENIYNDPSVKCPLLIYTEDEQEAMEMYSINVSSRWQKAQTEFCTGVLDPNSDADWNTYLAELEDLGLSTVLEHAQTAYDRTK